MKRTKSVQFLLFFLSVILTFAHRAQSAEWTVARVGEADFHKIQDALDASAPGDTLTLLDGTFLNSSQRFVENSWQGAVGWVEHAVHIRGGRGAHVQGTQGNLDHAFFCDTTDSVTFEGFQIQQTGRGFRIPGPALVENVRIVGVQSGMIVGTPTARVVVRDCSFEDLTLNGVSAVLESFVRLENCAFRNTSSLLGARGAWAGFGARIEIVSSDFDGLGVGRAEGNGDLTVSDCRAVNIPGQGVGAYTSGATVVLDGLLLSGGASDAPISYRVGLLADLGGRIHGTGIRIDNMHDAINSQTGARVALQQSEIVNWISHAVYLTAYPDDTSITLDLRNNYWGLTDSTSIADAIFDGTDDLETVGRGYVEFWPILTEPVKNEETSVGRLKSMFQSRRTGND